MQEEYGKVRLFTRDTRGLLGIVAVLTTIRVVIGLMAEFIKFSYGNNGTNRKR